MPEYRIKLSAPDINDADIAAVTGVMRSGWLSLGPKVEEFERVFASYLGVKHAVACNSGTSALHMMMITAGVGAGDEVITSPFSFIASANCIEMVGAKPVFVDIDPVTLNMDPKRIAGAITKRTKAILAVHIFGLSADMPAINAAASKAAIPVLEDACESLGATINGRKVADGTQGVSAAWGFYPNKQMTTGEGGMVTTNDDAHAFSIRRLRNQGRNPGAAWLEHDVLGYNFRLDEMSCALGISQVHRLDDILAAREKVAFHYNARLEALKGDVTTPPKPAGHRRSWFVYPIILRAGLSRDKLIAALGERRIQCGKYFAPPIHLQTFYRKRYGYKGGEFPVTEGISDQILALPFHSSLTTAQIDEVCDEIGKLVKSGRISA